MSGTGSRRGSASRSSSTRASTALGSPPAYSKPRPAAAGLAPRSAQTLLAQRLADDAILLAQVRGRVALARARPPRPADVPKHDTHRQRLLEPVPDRAPGAHVLRLFLCPDELLEVRE